MLLDEERIRFLLEKFVLANKVSEGVKRRVNRVFMRTETVLYTHVRSFEGTFDKCDFCGNDAGKLIQRRKSRRENGRVEALIVHIVCGWLREIVKFLNDKGTLFCNYQRRKLHLSLAFITRRFSLNVPPAISQLNFQIFGLIVNSKNPREKNISRYRSHNLLVYDKYIHQLI